MSIIKALFVSVVFVFVTACGGEELVDPPPPSGCAPAGDYRCSCTVVLSDCGLSGPKALSVTLAEGDVCSASADVDSGWAGDPQTCRTRAQSTLTWTAGKQALTMFYAFTTDCVGSALCKTTSTCTCE